MRFEARVEGRTLTVEVQPAGPGFAVRLGERTLAAELRETRPGFVNLLLDGRSVEAGLEGRGGVYTVHLPDRTLRVDLSDGPRRGGGASRGLARGPVRIEAPMPGRVVRLLVAAGQDVTAGQGLLVIEAMKMENELRAPRAGRVAAVQVSALSAVETGALLVVLE